MGGQVGRVQREPPTPPLCPPTGEKGPGHPSIPQQRRRTCIVTPAASAVHSSASVGVRDTAEGKAAVAAGASANDGASVVPASTLLVTAPAYSALPGVRTSRSSCAMSDATEGGAVTGEPGSSATRATLASTSSEAIEMREDGTPSAAARSAMSDARKVARTVEPDAPATRRRALKASETYASAPEEESYEQARTPVAARRARRATWRLSSP